MKKEFTKEGLKIGDVVGRFGFEQEVVEVLDNSFMISDGTWYTFEQAISHGWKIKDAEWKVYLRGYVCRSNRRAGHDTAITEGFVPQMVVRVSGTCLLWWAFAPFNY